jgi:hypothetical protein
VTTPPPLAIADADIMDDANEPAAMPAPVKPAAVKTAGAATTATPPPTITPPTVHGDHLKCMKEVCLFYILLYIIISLYYQSTNNLICQE